MVQPELIGPLLRQAGWGAALIALTMCLGYGSARVLSAAMTGRLGPVQRGARAQLRVPSVRSGAIPLTLLSLIAVVGIVLAVQGVLAGASRAVDASAGGISQLWVSWPQRVWAAAVVVLGLVGWVELVSSRRRVAASLAQTRQQVLDDLKARSGGHR